MRILILCEKNSADLTLGILGFATMTILTHENFVVELCYETFHFPEAGFINTADTKFLQVSGIFALGVVFLSAGELNWLSG